MLRLLTFALLPAALLAGCYESALPLLTDRESVRPIKAGIYRGERSNGEVRIFKSGYAVTGATGVRNYGILVPLPGAPNHFVAQGKLSGMPVTNYALVRVEGAGFREYSPMCGSFYPKSIAAAQGLAQIANGNCRFASRDELFAAMRTLIPELERSGSRYVP